MGQLYPWRHCRIPTAWPADSRARCCMISTVPLGGGLSSSAALEVCTATLIEAATGKEIDPIEKALLAQRAEHEFAGVPCGIMDQFVSVLGREDHLLLLDCRTHKTELVPMNDPSVSLLIINTNVKHELSGGEYAQRRAECEPAAKILGVASLRDATADQLERAKGEMSEVVYRRACHVIGEIERTRSRRGRHPQLKLADRWPAHVCQPLFVTRRLRSQLQAAGCRRGNCESIGIKGGVYGCRMTGGGFGGCASRW